MMDPHFLHVNREVRCLKRSYDLHVPHLYSWMNTSTGCTKTHNHQLIQSNFELTAICRDELQIPRPTPHCYRNPSGRSRRSACLRYLSDRMQWPGCRLLRRCRVHIWGRTPCSTSCAACVQCGPWGVYGGLCRGCAYTHSLSGCNRECGDENPQAPSCVMRTASLL